MKIEANCDFIVNINERKEYGDVAIGAGFKPTPMVVSCFSISSCLYLYCQTYNFTVN
jgi:hypothetical protein